jgi:hypothetical protein
MAGLSPDLDERDAVSPRLHVALQLRANSPHKLVRQDKHQYVGPGGRLYKIGDRHLQSIMNE